MTKTTKFRLFFGACAVFLFPPLAYLVGIMAIESLTKTIVQEKIIEKTDYMAVDIKKVPRLWFGSGFAHGCPIAEDTIVTAAHVLGSNESGKWIFWDSTWADGYGNSGLLNPEIRFSNRDLVIATPKEKLPFFFEVSKEVPAVGETLYVVGYDWDSKLEQKLYTVKLLEIFGAHMRFDGTGHPGSSGSCIFRKDGTVVGVNVWGFDHQDVGIGVSLLGKWGPNG